jgi:hypothetical protein
MILHPDPSLAPRGGHLPIWPNFPSLSFTVFVIPVYTFVVLGPRIIVKSLRISIRTPRFAIDVTGIASPGPFGIGDNVNSSPWGGFLSGSWTPPAPPSAHCQTDAESKLAAIPAKIPAPSTASRRHAAGPSWSTEHAHDGSFPYLYDHAIPAARKVTAKAHLYTVIDLVGPEAPVNGPTEHLQRSL